MDKYKSENYYSDEAKDLINKMLALKPEDRISIDKILEHSWLKGDTFKKEEIIDQFKKR